MEAIVMEKNFCPDCGTERYNSSNYCIKCGFNFNEIIPNENQVIEESAGEQSATIDHIVNDSHSNTIKESEDIELIKKEGSDVSFSHIRYADLSDIKFTLEKKYNTSPVHIESDAHDRNIFMIKTLDHRSITLKCGTFGAKEIKPPEENLAFNGVPTEDLRDIRSYLHKTFDTTPIHIDRDINDGNLYEVKTDQGKVLKLKLGASKIQVIGKSKKRYETTQEEVTREGKEYNVVMMIGFIFGIVSIFLSFIGIIPLIGIVLCIIGLATFKQEKHEGLWMGIVGLVLNILYLLANAHSNGHF